MNTRQPVSHEFLQPSMFSRLICAFFLFIKLTTLSVSMSTQTILKITKFNFIQDILPTLRRLLLERTIVTGHEPC